MNAARSSMSDRDLAQLSEYIAAVTGVRLDASKRYLLESRLEPVRREAQCASWDEFYLRARSGKEHSLERKIVDAITTNETFFFRDLKSFDLLRHKIIPDLLGEDIRTPVSIWSAASSTGQEAYSLTMVLEELLFDVTRCRVRILGTDISDAVVSTASRGEYNSLEISRGLVQKQVERYFVRSGAKFKIRDELRGLCRFQTDNLLAPTTSGSFDIVLCRNVLIYFSQADKVKVVTNLLARLKRGGVLLVGSTESLLGITDRVERREFHGASYYVLR